MAKDKLGHGSEAHREFHKSQVEHGKYGKGSHFHGVNPETMKEAERRFGADKLKRLDEYAHRQKAMRAAREGTIKALPIAHGRPK